MLCTPPPFKILVSNPNFSSMTLQLVVAEGGSLRQGGPVATPAPVTSTHYTAAIEVDNTYWDPGVSAPGPFYPLLEVCVGEHYRRAAVEFGAGLGSASGAADAVAAGLVDALGSVPGVQALADGATVYVLSNRPDGKLPVSVSNDTSVLLNGGLDTFSLSGPGGVALPSNGSTQWIPNPTPFQGAPVLA
jgi:hypothetical protein